MGCLTKTNELHQSVINYHDLIHLVVWCVYTGLYDAPSAAERWVAFASRSRLQTQPPASSLTGVKREQGQSISSAGT